MKNQINKQPEAKLQELASTARARLLSYAVLIALFGLVFSGDITERVLAVTDTTNATQNVTAGALSIDQVPNNIAFNDGAPGDSTLANITNSDSGGTRRIKITSTASATFSLTGYFNSNWYRSGTPATQMAIASRMRWFPTTNGVLADISGAGDSETANVAKGANANFAGIASGNALSLLTGSSSSKGKYALSNVTFQYDVPISATAATDYITTIITTLT